jgi:hypothetical protein
MGINSMLRTAAQSLGPSITGILASNNLFWVAFVVAGGLRVSYDITLWATFKDVPMHQYEKPEPGNKNQVGSRAAIDDEEELRESSKR